MPGYGEILLIFLLVLLIFGGKKIPEVARGLGKGIREFKKAKDEISDSLKSAIEEDETPPVSKELDAEDISSVDDDAVSAKDEKKKKDSKKKNGKKSSKGKKDAKKSKKPLDK